MLRGREGRRWRRSRRWNSVQAKVSLTVQAPREELVHMYLDYERWTQRFPETFRDVRLLRQDADRILVQVDHGDGPALGTIKRISEYEIELAEREPRYSVKVFNRFERVGDATRCVIIMDLRLKGAYALIAPILSPVVRRRIERIFVDPVKSAFESMSLSA